MQVADVASLANGLAGRLEQWSARAIAASGRFSLALSGGSAAEELLPALASSRLDWRHTHLFWADERAVAPDHADSNYALAKALLIDRVGLAPSQVHRMRGEAEDLRAAAADYERDMTRLLGDPPSFDVALLGVGPDGHVCSLFPGHAALAERDRLVIPVEDSPKPPPRRLTVTLPALRLARLLVIAAFGDAKSEIVRQACEDEGSPLPMALALRAAQEALLLLDAGAASRLRRQ